MAGAAAPAQTQEDLVPPAPSPTGFRLSGILLAVCAVVSVHLLLVGPVGVDLRVALPGQDLRPLSPGISAVFTLGIGIAAWVLAVIVERLAPDRARAVWTAVALVVLVASVLLILPLDVPSSAKWGLVALHATVGAVLIPAMQTGLD